MKHLIFLAITITFCFTPAQSIDMPMNNKSSDYKKIYLTIFEKSIRPNFVAPLTFHLHYQICLFDLIHNLLNEL